MTRGLADWRERILQQTLWTTAILAGIAYVPGVMVAASVVFGSLLPLHQQAVSLIAGPPYNMMAWIGSSGSLVFLSALLSLSIARLLRGLESSLIEQETGNRRRAGGIAHDFNNLLVPILMASEEARDEAPADNDIIWMP